MPIAILVLYQRLTSGEPLQEHHLLGDFDTLYTEVYIEQVADLALSLAEGDTNLGDLTSGTSEAGTALERQWRIHRHDICGDHRSGERGAIPRILERLLRGKHHLVQELGLLVLGRIVDALEDFRHTRLEVFIVVLLESC